MQGILQFQSHYGTIKGNKNLYIHSILQFQFHYGTIKGFESMDKKWLARLFQFHYGTIKGKMSLAHWDR